MPEGDTVHLTAGRLNRALAGERLLQTDFRVPAVATADLTGQVVSEVVARGKHILLRTDAGTTLHTHLKMDGAWHLCRPGAPWPGQAFQVRAVLRTEPWVAVGSRLGLVELIPTARESEVVGHLGPDVLGPDWDPDEVLRRLRAQPHREIGAALIDQRVMAGPGNVYRSEVCFLRGIHPWMKTGEVAELRRVVDLMKRVMEANRRTARHVTTGDARAGRERWVYGRTGRPCYRCGEAIRERPQGPPTEERATYWCPRCQPGAES